MTSITSSFSPKISVIIPVFNGEKTLDRCLQALLSGSLTPDEIILVDDQSADNTPEIARQYPLKYYRTERQSFSPAARNLGIKNARGDILIFLDSDVVVHENTVEKIRSAFITHPELAAVFGSYDDQPPEKNLVSQFRNLLHHYVHQHARKEASTFWTGCGAVRAQVFNEIGQFETGQDGMKDIEFGYRMKSAGYTIHLRRDILVTHLKRWTLLSMVRTDIFLRAAPWTTLLLEKASQKNDLNIGRSERLAAVFSFLALIGWPFALLHPGFLGLTLLNTLGLIWLKKDLIRFYYDQGGLGLLLSAFFLYQFYLLYSSVTFAVVVLYNKLVRHQTSKRAKDEHPQDQGNHSSFKENS